jgi:CheY-like chemotaxis protein
MKRKILWVEDGAFSDLTYLAGPLYASGDYSLVIASDASQGFRYLKEKEFDAVIMDIRLPPGNDPYFVNLYNISRESKNAARLGMAVLERVLKPSGEAMPGWIKAERFGVFTVESSKEVMDELDSMGVTVFVQKTTRTPRDVLIKIAEVIMEASRRKRSVR